MEITTDIALLLAIIVFTVGAFVREWMNMAVIAMVCCGLLLLFGLVSPEQAISGLSNPAVVTVMMFILSAGLVRSGVVSKLGLGIALENTGLAALIGEGAGGIGVEWGPLAMLSVLYLGTSLPTSFLSNNATAVLVVPIAFGAAAQLQVVGKPFLMAVAYAASASFMTPMGYQTNAMVFSPGNYRLTDYLKLSAPLTVAFWLLGSLLIPVVWPFNP